MSRSANNEAPSAARQVWGWVHFAVAAAVLGASAAGWSLAVDSWRIYTRKEPVPWPAGVEVDGKYRMTSLPASIGPYRLVADGEWERDEKGDPVRDGTPDGVIELLPDTMDLLGIGTVTDERNLPKRRSNWLSVCIYRDTRKAKHDPFQYWRLELYYYTGGVDLVPHVPDICAVAGGAVPVGGGQLAVSVPSAPGPWAAQPISFRAPIFLDERRGTRFVQYYAFSLNGVPENRREVVRLKLTNPFLRHAYFAKIQFNPLGAIRDERETAAAAREFAGHFLPHVLKVLPMPDDVEKLGMETGGD